MEIKYLRINFIDGSVLKLPFDNDKELVECINNVEDNNFEGTIRFNKNLLINSTFIIYMQME